MMAKGKLIYQILIQQHKLIFTAIPKNAITSLKYTIIDTFMSDKLTKFDINNVDNFHEKTRSFFNYINQETVFQLNNYLRVVIIRNPFDRLVSGWRNKIKNLKLRPNQKRRYGGFTKPLTFEEFIKTIYKQDEVKIDSHFAPQYRFISYKNQIFSDEILRFENLNNEWRKLQEKLKRDKNIRLKNLPLTNKSNESNKSYRTFYNDQTRKLVEEKFKKDLEFFDYEF